MQTSPTTSNRPAAAEQTITVGQLARILWRYRWWSLVAGVLVAAILARLGFSAQPMYEAQATLTLITHSQGSEVTLSGQSTETRPDQFMINTLGDQIKSFPVLSDAVKRGEIDKFPAYAFVPEPIKELAARLQVRVSSESYAVELRLRDEDRARSELILKCVIDAFLDWQTREQQAAVNRAVAFLDREIETARQRLDVAQAEIKEFRLAKGIASAQESDNLATTRLLYWNSERTNLMSTLSTRDGVLTQIAGIVGSTAQAVPGEQIKALLACDEIAKATQVSDAQKELAALVTTMTELEAKYLEKHPRMIEQRERIAARQLAMLDIIQQVRKGLQSARDQTEVSIRTMDSRISEEERNLTEFREAVIRLKVLEQESELKSSLLTALTSQRNEKAVQARMDGTLLTLLDPPSAGRFAIGIARKTVLVVSLVAGLVAAVLAAFLASIIDRRPHDPEMVIQDTGLPLLARIPRTPIATMIDEVNSVEGVAYSEAFRNLRTAVRGKQTHKGCQVLVVTSCRSGEGKSTITANLALSLVSMGAKVLLVDADLRRPRLHKLMGDDNSGGLGVLLSGVPLPSNPVSRTGVIFPDGERAPLAIPSFKTPRPPALLQSEPEDIPIVVEDESSPALQSTSPLANKVLPAGSGSKRDPLTGMIVRQGKRQEGEPLHFIPAGKRVSNPAELLAGASLAHAVRNWRADYDYVLIDTPPIGLVSDAITVAQHADSIIMVVAHLRTNRTLLKQVLEMFIPLKAVVSGFVYNFDPSLRSMHGQSYGEYYALPAKPH